jgi:DNA-binding MarR family transcriptional regulator
MQRTKVSPVTRSARPTAPSARTDNRAKLDDVVTAILTASRVLVGVSARSLADVEDTVTLTQFRSLVVLDSHGIINLNRLADLLAVNRSTAMRMIDRLLVAKLVTRQGNPANRREVLLDLTDEGRQLVRQVTNTRRAEIARIVKAMPPGERHELVNALRTFADAAGEPEATDTTARLGW